ncbi:hypothetical protein [Acinetobacter soli]|uniref:hypothetical protein n=1 Tax=Acinetobacter soli TaxID=487316 RepID=UPI00300AFC69
MKTEFQVGEVVELHYVGRMVLGSGCLVRIESIDDEYAVVTTGISSFLEKLINLRKISHETDSQN